MNAMNVLLTATNDQIVDTTKGLKMLHQEPSALVQFGPDVEPASLEVEYLSSVDLTPVEDVDLLVNTLLERLDSKDWLTVCQAFNRARQIAVFHTSSMDNILESVVILTIKALKSPRSTLCKTAIMATADFFKAYQDRMLDFLDPLLLQLLLKASQDKRFVCEEAERALLAMTTWMAPAPLLQKLKPYVSHRNPRIRAKASMCVYKSVSKLGIEGIKDFGLETLIQIAASQLNDQLPEARESARKMVMDLHAAYQKFPSYGHSLDVQNVECKQEKWEWEQFCQRQLPPRTAHAVLRVTCIAT
eukprot:c27535_g1_i3 orf=594-1499(+)